MKSHRNFIVSDICHNEFIIYIRKFTIVNILIQILYQEISITTGTYKVSIEFWQKINQELFKADYLMKLSKYSGNFAKAVKRSHNWTLFNKVSKIFSEFMKVFNFKSSWFMFCQNLIEIIYVPVVIYISQ